MKNTALTIATATLIALSFTATSAQTMDNPTRSEMFDVPTFTTDAACQTMIPTARTQTTYAFGSTEGPLDFFPGTTPRDAVVTLSNQGSADIGVSLYEQGQRSPIQLTLRPGRTITKEVAKIVDMTADCWDPAGGPTCVLALDVVSAEYSASHQAPPLDLWYPGPVAAGNAAVEPDYSSCLWEQEDLWTSMTPRKVDVLIDAFGDHDVEVEVEYEGGVFQTFDTDVSKPLNSPQRKIQLNEEDVVALRTRCTRMILNPCSVCEYSYLVSVLP